MMDPRWGHAHPILTQLLLDVSNSLYDGSTSLPRVRRAVRLACRAHVQHMVHFMIMIMIKCT